MFREEDLQTSKTSDQRKNEKDSPKYECGAQWGTKKVGEIVVIKDLIACEC